MAKLVEIFWGIVGFLVVAVFGLVFGTVGLLSIAIGVHPLDLVEEARWLPWLKPETVWPYNIMAVPLLAGAMTLVLAVFSPAAYRSKWLADTDSIWLPIAVIASFLEIQILMAFLLFIAGIVSIIGAAVIAVLVQFEAIGWATAEMLSLGQTILIAMILLGGETQLLRVLPCTENRGEDEAGGEEE